ncbi:AfsA-related hotdog domain-containing protein [Duganella sp. CT11-25]|uniref:AfsA-related hotdog domain-containing protein n=1 Tax=unclassified Duganella TaxID=2636909 RepID=UPI0039AED422
MNLIEIPPKLLHKDSADDVLISNYRPALPLRLDPDQLAASAAPWPALYGAGDGRQGCLAGADGARAPADDAWQAVRGAPYQWAERVLPAALARAEVDRFCQALRPRRRSSSYLLINRADHYFFYRKTHEHVPGVMLIEAQRQAVYHHLYASSAYVKGEITVSLNQLDARFHMHAELMYPIELVVDELDVPAGDRPRKLHYRVAFYQRGALLAEIDTRATVIAMPRFEKLRDIFLSADDSYAPLDAARLACVLTDAAGAAHPATLRRLSRQGCVTAPIAVDPAQVRSITVTGAGGAGFSAQVACGGAHDADAAWTFPGLAPGSLVAIGDLIKRAFVVASPPPPPKEHHVSD